MEQAGSCHQESPRGGWSTHTWRAGGGQPEGPGRQYPGPVCCSGQRWEVSTSLTPDHTGQLGTGRYCSHQAPEQVLKVWAWDGSSSSASHLLWNADSWAPTQTDGTRTPGGGTLQGMPGKARGPHSRANLPNRGATAGHQCARTRIPQPSGAGRGLGQPESQANCPSACVLHKHDFLSVTSTGRQ